MAPFHVYCTTYHAKGQAEDTMLMLCTVSLCNVNISVQLTLTCVDPPGIRSPVGAGVSETVDS